MSKLNFMISLRLCPQHLSYDLKLEFMPGDTAESWISKHKVKIQNLILDSKIYCEDKCRNESYGLKYNRYLETG
jgi:hypothetical protein